MGFLGARFGRAALLAAALLLSIVPAAQATFPGQNGKIAFTTITSAGGGVHVIEPDGSGLKLLIPQASDPAWSADGRRLALRRFGGGNGLYAANADGSGQALLRAESSSNPTPESQFSDQLYGPAWSPDGSTIAYTADAVFCVQHAGCAVAPLGIRAIAPDGSNDRVLIDRAARDAVYSPDGARIAWQDHELSGTPGLHVSNADGTGDTVLVPASEESWPSSASWSPDGSRIAFSQRVGTSGDHRDIYVMDADGGNQLRLTFDGVNGDPVWSPDGTKIAWVRDRGLWLMNADGTGQVALTNRIGISGSDWQPLAGPRRSDYKNASHFCKALRASLGDQQFAHEHGSHGACVSRSH